MRAKKSLTINYTNLQVSRYGKLRRGAIWTTNGHWATKIPVIATDWEHASDGAWPSDNIDKLIARIIGDLFADARHELHQTPYSISVGEISGRIFASDSRAVIINNEFVKQFDLQTVWGGTKVLANANEPDRVTLVIAPVNHIKSDLANLSRFIQWLNRWQL